jgi:ferritin-like metal-binding protein YciE
MPVAPAYTLTTMNDTDLTTGGSFQRYDSAGANDDAARDERHVIRTYLSDMLALERHIGQPLRRQLDMDDSAKYEQAAGIMAAIKSTSDAHVSMLEEGLKKAGGDAASPVKGVLSAILGAGAAAIGSARKSKVSKNLRDDQVALSLATISYTMLHATALGLGDAATAQLAQRHLEEYTPLVMQISKAMPSVVLQELADDGENVQVTAAQLAEGDTRKAWQAPADG